MCWQLLTVQESWARGKKKKPDVLVGLKAHKIYLQLLCKFKFFLFHIYYDCYRCLFCFCENFTEAAAAGRRKTLEGAEQNKQWKCMQVSVLSNWVNYMQGVGGREFSELICPNFDIDYHNDDCNSEREGEILLKGLS
jgi:hypothetical protein